MAVSRAVLKSFFETGDVPTEAEFASLIDSLLSLIDDSNLKNGIKIKSETDGKIEIIIDDSFFQLTTDGGSFAEAFFRAKNDEMLIGFGSGRITMSTDSINVIPSNILLLASQTSDVEVIIDINGLRIFELETFANNAAAIAGGLLSENIYKTATGELRIVV